MKRKGSSIIEYMALVTFILAALFVFQKTILRGFYGHWKAASDTFGHGKQYDPRDYGVAGAGGGTLECFYDNTLGQWVDVRCFDEFCDGPGKVCENLLDLSSIACQACMQACLEPECQG